MNTLQHSWSHGVLVLIVAGSPVGRIDHLACESWMRYGGTIAGGTMNQARAGPL